MDAPWQPVIKWLSDAGIPVGVASMFTAFMWYIDRRLSARETATEAADDRLSKDELAFRDHLFKQIEALEKQVFDLYARLESCHKMHEDSTRRAMALQIRLDALEGRALGK